MVDQPLRQILSPEELKLVPENYQGQTPRQIYNTPVVGGIAMTKMEPLFKQKGFTRDDAMKALSTPPDQPGKRSDAGTSSGLLDKAQGLAATERGAPGPQYAQADNGVRSDAAPERGKPPEPTPEPTQATSEPNAATPTGAPQGETAPQITPEMAKAFEAALQIDMGPTAAPPPPDALPVLPSSQPGGAGAGLSLAPSGLQNLATGPTAPGAGPMQSAYMPGSQGGGIAMLGVQPQTGVFSTPLLDAAAAQQPAGGFAASSLSPIAPQFMGWGGGFGGLGGTSGGTGFGGIYGDSFGGEVGLIGVPDKSSH